MSDNDYGGDRRLEGRVRELEQKVHSLEISDGQHKIEIAGLKGEISGLRSSSATSIEVKAASDVLTIKLDNLHRDLAAIKTIMAWTAGIILTGVIGAGLKLILVP